MLSLLLVALFGRNVFKSIGWIIDLILLALLTIPKSCRRTYLNGISGD
jgi:hypothetical protein